MKRFSGPRVLTGCALFIAIIMGSSGIHSSGYSMLPDTFGISITMVGTLGMTISVVGMISSLLVTTVKKKIGLRGILYYDAAVLYLVALSAKLLGSSIITLILFFFSIGTTLYMGGHAVQSEIVSNWYVKGRAQKISVVLGAALLGQAFYQFVGGQVFSRMTQLDGWFWLHLVNGTLMLLIATFLVVADTPSKIGQEPYGADELPAAAPAKAESTGVETAKTEPAKPRRSIYANPALWLCVLGRLGLCGGVNYITTYATMYFTDGGISLSTATIILSVCTLSAAFFSFLNGQMLSRFKTRGYILVLLGSVILSNLGMIVYSAVPSVIFIALIVLFYGIGYSGSHCMNLVAGILFDPEDAANANSKIYGFGAAGGLVMSPLTAALVENFGYNTMYFMIIVLAAVSLAAFQSALVLAKRQGKKI